MVNIQGDHPTLSSNSANPKEGEKQCENVNLTLGEKHHAESKHESSHPKWARSVHIGQATTSPIEQAKNAHSMEKNKVKPKQAQVLTYKPISPYNQLGGHTASDQR